MKYSARDMLGLLGGRDHRRAHCTGPRNGSLPQVQVTPVEYTRVEPRVRLDWVCMLMSAAYMVLNTDSAVTEPVAPAGPGAREPAAASPSPSDGPMPPVRPQAEQPALEPFPPRARRDQPNASRRRLPAAAR